MSLYFRFTPLPDRPLSSSSSGQEGPERKETDGQQVRSGPGQPTTYRPNTPHLIRVCPDCAGPIVRSSGCISCTQCGWGKCG